MVTLINDFLSAVEQYPDKSAVVQGERSLSYGDLARLAANFAALLVSNGLEKGDRVALAVENIPEYAGLYYGVLLAAGAVVAMNIGAKETDLKNWIAHSDVAFIFTKQEFVGGGNVYELLRRQNELLQPVATLEEIINGSDELKPRDVSADDLASIIYTSGTTSAPKGVMLSHGNLRANMESIRKYLPVIAEDRVLTVLPFYYSYGNSVLHTNLGVGATLILENSMMFPVKVLRSMQNNAVTAFYGVASTYAILLGRSNLRSFDLSSLRYVAQAGGPMPKPHIKAILDIIPNSEFYMMYGATEASARLGYIPADKILEKMGSAGKAIPDVTLEIRDDSGKSLPSGEEGEIYATGPNIMRGYWKNPGKTAEVLVAGWLRTGDIATMDKDGYIFMKGRRTDMIKSGANRISPEEIEDVLAELNDVEESAAIGIPDDIMGQVVKVFVVIRQGHALDKMTIMRHCKQKLAQYKLPREIAFIKALPKTPSGKVRRFELMTR